MQETEPNFNKVAVVGNFYKAGNKGQKRLKTPQIGVLCKILIQPDFHPGDFWVHCNVSL